MAYGAPFGSPLGESGAEVVYSLGALDAPELFAIEMQRVSATLALWAEAERQGLLLHGALAEREGQGIILAAPGGTGKSTASRRLPAPWRALCDDSTLVLPDGRGGFCAHPWPTWSTFFFGGTGGAWNVQEHVPLRAVFFLEQAPEEQLEPLGPAAAACSLNQSAEQIAGPSARRLLGEVMHTHRLRRFATICTVARAVPAYTLKLSLTGAFWREVERALDDATDFGSLDD